jgi:uncharacterized membrane protein YbhN (UPF0104 family)
MADNTDVLLKLCEEEWTQGRQSESQRATVTNFIITISAAILGFLVQKDFTITSLPLAILLIALGVYGAVISAKLYERWQFHRRRARYWRKRVDELHPDARIEQLKVESEAKHKLAYSKLEKIRLNRLWLALHILIVLIGVACTVIIIIRWL